MCINLPTEEPNKPSLWAICNLVQVAAWQILYIIYIHIYVFCKTILLKVPSYQSLSNGILYKTPQPYIVDQVTTR